VTALLRGDDEETVAEEAADALLILEGACGEWPTPGASAAPAASALASEPPLMGEAHVDGDHDLCERRCASTSAQGCDAPSVEVVLQAAQHAGLAVESFERYASQRWGAGWKRNAAGRRRALAQIERCGASLLSG